ncbi:hypothetical protein L249_3638 [Ophiocordyceps polyrhachis-furcata BCC 54312]|uniref:Uncharacterized protein n=1 Tax=Ophiocordyceps polyrhachis-furcata BCC 54312 TaxID=1330021 RepID=A0A367KYY1_9HYPO|nr:hypothetical protein L249_3638 [Ophiocordyceps polyrhachis-furcata BCC 54312]
MPLARTAHSQVVPVDPSSLRRLVPAVVCCAEPAGTGGRVHVDSAGQDVPGDMSSPGQLVPADVGRVTATPSLLGRAAVCTSTPLGQAVPAHPSSLGRYAPVDRLAAAPSLLGRAGACTSTLLGLDVLEISLGPAVPADDNSSQRSSAPRDNLSQGGLGATCSLGHAVPAGVGAPVTCCRGARGAFVLALPLALTAHSQRTWTPWDMIVLVDVWGGHAPWDRLPRWT